MKIEYLGATFINDKLILRKSGTVTIDASDEIETPTTSLVFLTPNSPTTDNLDGIGPGYDGQIVFLKPKAGNDITLVHNGTVSATKRKLMLATESNFLLDNDHDLVMAMFDLAADQWHVMITSAQKRQIFITLTNDNAGASPTFSNLGFLNSWEDGTITIGTIIVTSYENVTGAAHQYDVFKDGSTVTGGAGITIAVDTRRQTYTSSFTLTNTNKIEIDRIDANTTNGTGGIVQVILKEA